MGTQLSKLSSVIPSNYNQWIKLLSSNWTFLSVSLASVFGLHLYARRFYPNRRFISLFLPVAISMNSLFYCTAFWNFSSIRELKILFLYCQIANITQATQALIQSRLRPLWYRLLITWPGSWFTGVCLSGAIFSILVNRGTLMLMTRNTKQAEIIDNVCCGFSICAASLGLYQSLYRKTGSEIVEIDLRCARAQAKPIPIQPFEGLERVYCNRIYQTPQPDDKLSKRDYLTIFQLTDVHIGPCMSVERLKRICTNAVALKPDLILITGDLDTIEARNCPHAIQEGFSPLQEYKGKVIACYGNHDYENFQVIRDALLANDILILEDNAALVNTIVGPVQVIGSRYNFRDIKNREAHLQEMLKQHAVQQDHIKKILLLHNPSDFQFVPPNMVDITLSGHYHGGQIGLLSLGLNTTILSAACQLFQMWDKSLENKRKWTRPDHGLFRFKNQPENSSHLYAHRGTGFYGFPLRMGVPAEQSILRVYF